MDSTQKKCEGDSANASNVRPCQRPDRQNDAETTTKTLWRASMLKTTARWYGQHHLFVSAAPCIMTTFYSDMLTFTRHIQKEHQKVQSIPSLSFNTISK